MYFPQLLQDERRNNCPAYRALQLYPFGSYLCAHLARTTPTNPPQSLIDDVINSINTLIYQAISSLESGLLSTPPERLGFSHASNGTIPDTDEDGNVEYPEARLEIENGLHQLETLLESTVDKAFDKFEIYVLRNIFTVPEELLPHVRLKHYEVGFIALACGCFGCVWLTCSFVESPVYFFSGRSHT